MIFAYYALSLGGLLDEVEPADRWVKGRVQVAKSRQPKELNKPFQLSDFWEGIVAVATRTIVQV